MAESVLHPYRQEIARLYFEERDTQAEILRYLKQAHHIEVDRSTLSRFLKSLPEASKPPVPGDPGVSPEAERFLEQYGVFEVLVQGNEEIIGAFSQLQSRMGILEDAAAQRHEALLSAFGRIDALEIAAGQRHDTLLAAFRQSAARGGQGSDPSIAISVLHDILKQQAQDIAAIRQGLSTPPAEAHPASVSWLRALLMTGAFWAVLLVLGTVLYVAPWL
jgi:hypothetical protein